ncbi:MAG: HRDC domain-containing protein, partial [Thermoguttaceae bacterium]
RTKSSRVINTNESGSELHVKQPFWKTSDRTVTEWLFDVQLAAGFIGIDYPAGFRSLVEKLLGVGLTKTETLTNWLRRPLSERQVEYALNDVRHLASLSSKLKREMKKLNRFAWFHDESIQSCFKLQQDLESQKWRKITKVTSLPLREQAIVRELWYWRDRLAKKTNQISGRVLRDDLLIEIAKLKSSDISRIETIRGLNRSDIVRQYGEIAAAIDRALNLEASELPAPSSRQSYPQYNVMTQFMFTAFNMICKKQRIATSLVGTQTDVREFIAYMYGTLPEGIVPRLTRGWREHIVGDVLKQLFDGKIAMRLNNHIPDEPIEFVED